MWRGVPPWRKPRAPRLNEWRCNAFINTTPRLNEYVAHYLTWIAQTQAKKPKTITQERSVLNRWVRHFGATRLTQVSPRDLNQHALLRKQSGVGNWTVNVDVLVLGNLYRFAEKEGMFHGKLPMENWETLEYRPGKQQLLTNEELDHFCDVAVSTEEGGTPRFKNGEMLADAVRFMSLCGVRVKSAFAVRWSDVDSRPVSSGDAGEKTGARNCGSTPPITGCELSVLGCMSSTVKTAQGLF